METIVNDCDAELENIDIRIMAHKEQIRKLKTKKIRLLEKRKNVDMDVVLQCIEDKGLTANDVLKLISNAEGSH